jgi:SAM-dependent methyltransferase
VRNEPHPTAATPESARLLDYWNRRYERFVLSESGWWGAGEQLNERIYACKVQALRRAIDDLNLGPNFSLLDAGCGQGYFTRFYQQRYPRAQYTGVDISSRVVDHLRQTVPGARIEVGDLSQWRDPRGTSFDVIQAIDVFQIILDDGFVERVVTNLASQLTGRGALLATVAFPPQTFEPAPYLRHRTRGQWTSVLASCGLAITREAAIYYWLPAGGPRNKYARYAFDRLGPTPLYVVDRVAFKLGVPQPTSSPIDNRMRLVTIQRIRA